MNHTIDPSHQNKSNKNLQIVLIVAILLFIGWDIYNHFQVRNLIKRSHDFNRVSPGLDLINPTVVKNQLSDVATKVIDEVSDYVKDYSTKNQIESFGLHVRDLDSGYGFGINEDEPFIPASLLKIITMISYYKASESNPQILKDTYVFEGTDYNAGQTFKPKQEMEEGKSYTVDELIDRSIKYSDNNANEILLDHLDEDFYRKIFTALGIEYPKSNIDPTMTPKVYSNVFRILYNSTFLTEINSQKALDLLNQTEYNRGIQAGLNGHVTLSNKFGERSIEENGVKYVYLHDCGVIYTKHPYILCVMSKGKSALLTEEVLRDVSKIVYENMKY
jgi:beta-lactamase class A